MFQQVREAIVEALRRTGVEPVLVEDFSASSQSPTQLLQDHIRKATFAIADVTGGNPYVLYEVGFAHAMQKPVLLITQDLESVPAPLKSDYFLLVYQPQDLARLQAGVTSWARRFVGRDRQET